MTRIHASLIPSTASLKPGLIPDVFQLAVSRQIGLMTPYRANLLRLTFVTKLITKWWRWYPLATQVSHYHRYELHILGQWIYLLPISEECGS